MNIRTNTLWKRLRSYGRGRKVCFAVLAFLLAATTFLACERFNNYPGVDELIAKYADNRVNEYLARQLIKNKVVFIADQQPGEWRCRRTIVDFLDHWSRQAINGSSNDSLGSIALILDADSAHVESIHRYIKSWDYAEFRNIHITCKSGFTTADIEFYWRLGNVQHRITDYNLRADSVTRLTFKIVAGKAPYTTLSGQAVQAGEQNRLNAEFIAEYSRQHPDTRLLAFYNAEQLQRRFPSDDPDQSISADSSVITLLGEVWKQADTMVIIGAAPTDCWGWFYDELEAPGRYYVITDPLTAQIINRESELTVCKIDGLIMSEPDDQVHLPINRIPSANILDCLVSGLAHLDNVNDLQTQKDLSTVITYLEAVSGEPPQKVNVGDSLALRETMRRWQVWQNKAQASVVADIISLKLWIRLIDRLPDLENQQASALETAIMSILPGAPEFDGRFKMPTSTERADQLKSYVTRARRDIIIRTLVNILWVGTQEEKSAAIEALCQETDTNLGTAREWSEWFRAGKKLSIEAEILSQ